MKQSELPLVSVLVPVYNHERYVAECLASIVADPYPNLEILVTDDGSTDGSLQVVQSWLAGQPAAVRERCEVVTQANQGLTSTLNALVRRSKGEFLTIVASDDYLLPGGIGARVDYLFQRRDKGAVIGDSVVVDQNGTVVHRSALEGYHRGRKPWLSDPRWINYELVFRWCVPGPVFMARRDLYEQVGYYDETIAVEDRDFYLRLISRGLLGFVDTTVSAYRIHTGNFSRDPRRELSYSNAMLQTVTRNLSSFSGLRRTYFKGEQLKLRGVIARLEGRDSLYWKLMRLSGGLIISSTKRVYAAYGCILPAKQSNAGDPATIAGSPSADKDVS